MIDYHCNTTLTLDTIVVDAAVALMFLSWGTVPPAVPIGEFTTTGGKAGPVLWQYELLILIGVYSINTYQYNKLRCIPGCDLKKKVGQKLLGQAATAVGSHPTPVQYSTVHAKHERALTNHKSLSTQESILLRDACAVQADISTTYILTLPCTGMCVNTTGRLYQCTTILLI